MGSEQRYRAARSRRGFLAGAAVAGVGVTAGPLTSVFGIRTVGAARDNVASILDVIATVESLAITFYHAALSGATFHIDEAARESLRLVLAAEMHHVRIVQRLGGASLGRQFYLPERMLSDAVVFVRTGLRLEAAFGEVYVAATHQFADLGQPALAATAARLGANEAQHLALLGHLAGMRPDMVTLPEPILTKVVDAMNALAPFLHGGADMAGPVVFPVL